MNRLDEVLLMFRLGLIALICDVEKMYLSVGLKVSDRGACLFFWWPEGDITKPMVIYRPASFFFGLKPSGFVTIKCLLKLAEQEEDKDVQECIRNNFYVDDNAMSGDSVDHIIRVMMGMKKRLASGNFRLTKFA